MPSSCFCLYIRLLLLPPESLLPLSTTHPSWSRPHVTSVSIPLDMDPFYSPRLMIIWNQCYCRCSRYYSYQTGQQIALNPANIGEELGVYGKIGVSIVGLRTSFTATDALRTHVSCSSVSCAHVSYSSVTCTHVSCVPVRSYIACWTARQGSTQG